MEFPPLGGGSQYHFFSIIVFFPLHPVEEIKTSSHNPIPELLATRVRLPYGMKLIVNSLVKSTFRIMSEPL